MSPFIAALSHPPDCVSDNLSVSKRLVFSIPGGSEVEIEIYPGTTQADMFAMLSPLVQQDSPIAISRPLRIARRDGTLLPLSPCLPANSSADPYIIGSFARRSSTPAANEAQDHASESLQRDLHGILMKSVLKIEEFSNKISALPDLALTLRQLHEVGRQFDAIESFYSALEKKHPDLQCGISPISKFVRKSAKLDQAIFNDHDVNFGDDIKGQLKHAIFNNWRWAENQMTALMECMFHDWGLLKRFNIDTPTLRRFLLTVKENYNPNPFHNFRHAFCVTQMFYGMVNETGVAVKLKEIDLLLGLISCIVHDVDHPGFNNAYQINARTDLAILYNDQSPLENHHCSLAFSIMRLPECNILKSLDRKEFEYVRKGIIRCVLSTDMSKHAEIMAKFNLFADKFNYEDQDHKDTLIVMLVKCSDISNEARPPNVAEPWLDCLLEEYFVQSDREKAEGLPVAPFMDREKVTKPSAQIGFIEFVMLPMFNSIARVLPQLKSTVINQINKSLVYYRQLMEEQKQQQLQQKQAQGQTPAPSSPL